MKRALACRGRAGFVVLLASSLILSAHAAADAEPGLSATRLLNQVRVLASDEFDGRAPGTPGEEKTVRYLIQQF